MKIKDKVWMHHKGRIYAVSLKSARAGAEEGALELSAPFTCKVLKIAASAGQKIKKGEPVLTVEAMKMEYAMSAPKDGVLKEILVKVGQVVQQGTPFVQWE